MNEAKMDRIEHRLDVAYNECFNINNLYEEELKTSYVKKQRIEDFEGKFQSLEEKIASIKDQLKAAIEAKHVQGSVEEIRHTVEVEFKIDDKTIGVIVQAPIINVEGEVSQSNGAPKRGVMLNMLSHTIGILKRISQDASSAFTSLKTIESLCNEVVAWLYLVEFILGKLTIIQRKMKVLIDVFIF